MGPKPQYKSAGCVSYGGVSDRTTNRDTGDRLTARLLNFPHQWDIVLKRDIPEIFLAARSDRPADISQLPVLCADGKREQSHRQRGGSKATAGIGRHGPARTDVRDGMSKVMPKNSRSDRHVRARFAVKVDHAARENAPAIQPQRAHVEITPRINGYFTAPGREGGITLGLDDQIGRTSVFRVKRPNTKASVRVGFRFGSRRLRDNLALFLLENTSRAETGLPSGPTIVPESVPDGSLSPAKACAAITARAAGTESQDRPTLLPFRASVTTGCLQSVALRILYDLNNRRPL